MSTKRTYILSLLLGLAAVFYFYSPILLAPSDYVLVDKGDGLKTYYSMLYHIKYDADYLHFKGMNYPYGDLFSYTDGHFIIANGLKALDGVISRPEDYAVAVFNLSILLSLPLCVLVLSMLFKELGVSAWKNVLFSLAVAMLNPLLFRMMGHLTMTYSWAIPLAILFFVRFKKEPGKIRYMVGSFFLLLLLLWIHPYLGVMTAGLVLLAELIDVSLFRKLKEWRIPLWIIGSCSTLDAFYHQFQAY